MTRLGEFEQLALLAILRLGPDQAYGSNIILEIEGRTERTVSVGALYTTLQRLERKGLVRSGLGDSTPKRGGRAKRLYTITLAGYRTLSVSLHSILRMADGLGI